MLQQMTEIVRQAGELIRTVPEAERVASEKTGPRDLVTKYDRRVQEFLRSRLTAMLPQAAFMGEEDFDGTDYSRAEWLFIVDPIDGTTNFVQGFHNSSISVALLHHGVAEYGIVYNPYDGELYTARRGAGAALNGAPIHCANRDLAHSLLIFGTALYYPELTEETMDLFVRTFPLVQDVRRFGSAALDLCYVAAGKAGVFFECRLCPWDYAAGALIAREAGCRVTRIGGQELDYFRKCSVLAGSPTAHREFSQAVGKDMP